MLRGEQNVALENKEQVEILKGISAIQSGMSTSGGVVNYVSKRPKDIRSVTVEADSHGGNRVATDLVIYWRKPAVWLSNKSCERRNPSLCRT